LLAAQSEQNQRLAGRTLAELRQHWQTEQASLNRWQQLETLAQRQREIATQQATQANQLQQGQIKITAQEAVLMTLRNQHKELNAQVADKQKLLDQERRIQSLEAHRQELQAGTACPLCGSAEHPAIAAYQALDVSATEAALKEKQTALEALTQKGLQAKADHAASQATQKEWKAQQEKTTQEIARCQAQWTELCGQLGANDWQDSDKLKTGRTTAEQALAALALGLKAADEGELAVIKAGKSANDHTLALQTSISQLGTLQQAVQTNQARLVELKQSLQTRLHELAELDTRLGSTLGEAGHELPGEPALWLQERDGEWLHWQQTQRRRQELLAALSKQQGLCELAQSQASLWAERWQLLRSTTKNDGIFETVPTDDPATALLHSTEEVSRLTQALAALDGRQKQLEISLTQQQKTLTEALAKWQSALNDSPFDDLTAFVAALLPAEDRHRLMQLKETLQKARQQAEAVLNAARSKWQELEKNQPLANPPLPGEGAVPLLVELEEQLNRLEVERRTLSEQLGAQRALLISDEQRRVSQQALFAQITAQTTESDIWQRLDSMIGSARGDKFRKFAQGLTLDHLLHLANRHLARLHGRYLLRRKATGELELDIIDSWQGDAARDTRTLSGGESFLVSLALALALSDLVSHKTSIDSLFLDEGFGTLDADTLEIALTALDSLNASGKMIGIISHVEGLKERIPAQIRVDKGGGIGHSQLRIQ
jgi:exonuclease SbcC